MAGRMYGRYLTKTHRDEDWAALTTMQHDCFMALLSAEDITWAGIVPYLPLRFAGLAADLTEKKVIKTWAELAAARMILIDQSTGEVLVRTFLRHDNVLAKPNLTKAFLVAYEKVRSEVLAAAIRCEVAKLGRDTPTLAGLTVIRNLMPELLPEQFPEQCPEQCPRAMAEPVRERMG